MAVPQKKINSRKSALESKGLEVNLVKTKVLVSEIGQVIAQPSSKNDSFDICGWKTMANVVLCTYR